MTVRTVVSYLRPITNPRNPWRIQGWKSLDFHFVGKEYNLRLVVIGGDAAGMSAASRAKRNIPTLEVTVLEKTNDVSYSACGMPYNIADIHREMNDLVVREAQVFRDKQGIDLRLGHCVESIDRETKRVSGKDLYGQEFNIPYDKLLIATGASPIIPDLPGFNQHGVMGLKTLENGRNIKSFIDKQDVRQVVIIGMGYIALEMCEALRARKIEVHMVKPRPIFLPWMPDELASSIKKEVEDNGVKVHLGHKIDHIDRNGNMLRVVCSDLTLEGEMVLVAVGVTPNSKLASDARIDLGLSKAISVDRTLRTSDEDVFAAGDCADAFHVVTGEKTWIPLALRANRAGWAVADNLTGKRVELSGVAGTSVFKVFDLEVARTGLGIIEAKKADFEPVEVVIKARSRAHAHPGASTIWVQMVGDRSTGRLLGAQLVGKEGAAHRINATAVALHRKMTVEEFSQCDLAYAPPFSPVWDPMLTAANQLIKRM
ncbi:MAG: FAD-dependent oxidoreductase [Thermodesulfobacteriota bacterium]|nr:FAD-dependent oxidoreductase [Thermodesulfobacteriota bacterium]